MNGYASSERSSAFHGARLAFSSPSSEKPQNENQNGTYGALTAASAAGGGGRKISGRHGNTHPQQQARFNIPMRTQDTGSSSYIAANLAARRSTELLLNPTASTTSSVRFRPSPQRSYSDITAAPKNDGPSINNLIRRYEVQESVSPRDQRPRQLSSKKVPSLKKPEYTTVNPLIQPSTAERSLKSRHSLPLPRSPSSSASSSYASATDEPSFELPEKTIQSNAHNLNRPTKPPPRPTPTFSRSKSTNTISNVRQREEILSNSIIPSLSIDSLANAMVASSLATSRAPSPTKPTLPPPPRRRSRPHLFHRTHSADEAADSRTPSPPNRIMRTTMRAPPPPPPLDPNADPEMKQHRANRFLNKHPNKHREGDRKRWRDQITEGERKRYEGVWAANKGLLLNHQQDQHQQQQLPQKPASNDDNGVLNLIVRDIWSRSHLPPEVLEEIWNLVAPSPPIPSSPSTIPPTVLGKEQFVVGTWLVDQRLKGRKLPAKVSESVWFSARGLVGVKVKRRR
ncbi:MAG: hypothetical protein L6R37_004832 [Teloschistes peruensis]|nr:MAG: hypothetical protein L6R37_004832 [Teloschistes peruensis]